jgi:5-methylcytosine-specific restriction endonuclease McrA
MYTNKDLEVMRRDILRITGSEDDAMQFLLALTETDWREVHGKDVVRCAGCGKDTLYHEGTLIKCWDDRLYRKHCVECSSKPITRTCWICNERFLTTYLDSRRMYCLRCRDLPCPVCKKAPLDEEIVCEMCQIARNINYVGIKHEETKILNHITRAQKRNLPSTLNLYQWFSTLDFFNWKCAYCQVSSYEVIDHFIPLCKMGGTIHGNCVPACVSCNRIKGQRHPDRITAIPSDALNHVWGFLKQFS